MYREAIIWAICVVVFCVTWVALDKALSSPVFVELLRTALEIQYD